MDERGARRVGRGVPCVGIWAHLVLLLGLPWRACARLLSSARFWVFYLVFFALSLRKADGDSDGKTRIVRKDGGKKKGKRKLLRRICIIHNALKSQLRFSLYEIWWTRLERRTNLVSGACKLRSPVHPPRMAGKMMI